MRRSVATPDPLWDNVTCRLRDGSRRVCAVLLTLAGSAILACAEVEPPDTTFREHLEPAYQTCFDVVERETGKDLSVEALSDQDAPPDMRLARNRIIAAVNEAADAARAVAEPIRTGEPIRLPVLFVREPGDSAYAEDALYDLECSPEAPQLAPTPGPVR